jgi:hypothetical protein
MATAKNQALEATQPQVPLTTHQQDKEAAWPDAAKRNQREYHEWNRRCASELKKHDGLSTGARFFGAAFSLLFAGKERADLDRVIDGTIDAETSEETLNSFLHDRIRACGHRGDARAKQYVADYFAGKETRNREKRFHDAVVFLLEEGFTREELHKLAAQAEEA